MKRWIVLCIAILSCAVSKISAQDNVEYAERVNQYVAQYKGFAMAEQKRCGMPAAIILAQAILETEAGSSELVKGANNHFGIKCKNNWSGPTFTHTDDIADECFRKYKTVLESYKDHSDYLKNTPRYASLFKLSVTDYAAWAYGLKQCGYATNPIYAQKLIGLVEDYHLQEYTYIVMNGKSNIYKEAIAKSEKTKTDTIKPTISVPQQTDTFAFKKIKKAPEQPISTPPLKKIDTALTAKTVDSSVQKIIPVSKVNDTNYARAITNIPANQSILKSGDSGIVKKDTIFKSVIAKTDTSTQVPANINAKASANPLNGNEPTKQNNESRIVKMHGLKAFYAHKGDMLLEYAVKFKIRYAKLLELNDLPDAPLERDMYIYLEKKGSEGAHAFHIVQNGETLQEISQAECIQLKHLIAYNHLYPGEVPASGTKLFLKQSVTQKPLLLNTGTPKSAIATNDTVAKLKPQPDDHYIVKPATEETPLPVSATTSIAKPAGNTIAVAPATTIVIPETAIAKTENAGPVSSNKETGQTDSPQEGTITVKEDKLTQLKSKLDKVVYSSDNESTQETVQATQAAQTISTPPQTNTEPLQAVQKPVIKATTDSSKYYIVKDGDTIYNISHRFNISMRQLNSWNNLDSDSGIKKGMKLKIKE